MTTRMLRLTRRQSLLRITAYFWGLLITCVVYGHTGSHHHEKVAEATTQNAAFVALQATPQGPQLIHVNQQDKVTAIYKTPSKDKILQLSHHPTQATILVAYHDHSTQQQGIYSLEYSLTQQQQGKANDPLLTPLLVDNEANTWLFDPVFSADGQHIFYVSALLAENQTRAQQNLKLQRFTLSDNSTTLIAANATSPFLSENGRYLSYIEDSNNVVVVNLSNMEKRVLPLPSARMKVHFPRISERHQSLYVMTTQRPINTQIPFLKSAWAHPGSQHQEYYGWQLPLSASSLSGAHEIIQTEDVRALDIQPDTGNLGYVNGTGLHLYANNSKTSMLRYADSHLWKIAFTAH